MRSARPCRQGTVGASDAASNTALAEARQTVTAATSDDGAVSTGSLRAIVRGAILPPVLVEHRDFRLLWIGQTVSWLGSAVSVVAVPLLLLSIGGTAADLGTVLALQSGSYLAVILLSGIVADRLARRPLIVVVDLVRGTATAVGAVLALTHMLTVPEVYVFAALFGAADAFFQPATSALLAEVLPRDRMQQANSWRSLSLGLARVLGGGLGALIVATAGAPVAVALDALTYFVSAALAAAVRAGTAPLAKPAPLIVTAREGVLVAWRSRWIRLTLLIFAIANVVLGPLPVVVVPLAAVLAPNSALALGAFASASAAGAITAAALLTRVQVRRARGTLAYVAAATSALGFTLVPLVGGTAGFAMAGFLLGSGNQVFGIIWSSSLQQIVPGDKLGRVTSLDWFISLLFLPIGALVVARAVEVVGPHAVLVAGGTGVSLVLLAALALPTLRDYGSEIPRDTDERRLDTLGADAHHAGP